MVNVILLEEGEHSTAVITTRDFPADEHLFFATTSGMVKKTAMNDYDRSRRDGIIAINLKKGDELVNVRRVKQGEKVILCSTAGKAILFDESEIRPTGRATSGVRGITLKDGARMLGMEISNGKGDLLVVTERGYGKRTPVAEYPEQRRGGQGVSTISMTARKGDILKVVESFKTLISGDNIFCFYKNVVNVLPVFSLWKNTSNCFADSSLIFKE